MKLLSFFCILLDLSSNLVGLESGTFTATLGTWYTVDLGFKPNFVQLISTDNIASIQYLEPYSSTKYAIGALKASMETVTLGNTPSYGYFNFQITDTGFKYFRSYNSALTMKWLAGKL